MPKEEAAGSLLAPRTQTRQQSWVEVTHHPRRRGQWMAGSGVGTGYRLLDVVAAAVAGTDAVGALGGLESTLAKGPVNTIDHNYVHLIGTFYQL